MFILLLKFAAWIAAGLLVLLVSAYVAYKVKHPDYTKDKTMDIDLWKKDQ